MGSCGDLEKRMITDGETLVLGAHGNLQNDDILWEFLTSHSGSAIRIDLSEVTEVTAARLQLLISAHKQRVADGLPMVLTGMTETFRNGLARLGSPEDYFEEERT